MKFPDIFLFQNYESYFAEVVRLNLARSKVFSYRHFARRLKWPHSYLPDLIQGRKKLTISRAVEFGHFAKLGSFAMERLVYFAMIDSTHPPVYEYFRKKLQVEQTPVLPDETVTIEDSTIEKEDFDILPFAIFEILIWAGGKISTDEVSKLLFTFNDLQEDEIRAAFEFLIQKKIIRPLDSGFYEIPRKMIFMHNKSGKIDALSQHRELAENFIRFLPKTKGPCTYNSGFVQFPKAEVPQILEKIYMLRNWFEQLNQETLDNPKLPQREKIIFQYDLNLFPIIDRDVANSISTVQPLNQKPLEGDQGSF